MEYDGHYLETMLAKAITTKENISDVLKGFERSGNIDGYEIIKVYGWDYPNLIEAYQKASKIAREDHVPVLIHVN